MVVFIAIFTRGSCSRWAFVAWLLDASPQVRGKLRGGPLCEQSASSLTMGASLGAPPCPRPPSASRRDSRGGRVGVRHATMVRTTGSAHKEGTCCPPMVESTLVAELVELVVVRRPAPLLWARPRGSHCAPLAGLHRADGAVHGRIDLVSIRDYTSDSCLARVLLPQWGTHHGVVCVRSFAVRSLRISGYGLIWQLFALLGCTVVQVTCGRACSEVAAGFGH